MSYKKLKRSNTNSVIGGVCGGLGEYFDIDPIIFRIIFVILAFVGGGGCIIYLILWLFIPRDTIFYQPDGTDRKDNQNPKPNYSSAADTNVPYEEIDPNNQTNIDKKRDRDNTAGALVAGIVLIIVGSMFLVQKFWNVDVFRNWWPLILVGAGAIFLFTAINNKSK